MTASSQPQRSAREQFDRQAACYDQQWNRWTEASLTWLLEHSDCRNTDDLLDVATGGGFTALAFAPRVRTVTALDVSPNMLAQTQQRAEAAGLHNLTCIEGSAEAMPLPDGSFDLVTCRVAPHHFLSMSQFLAETRRVLRPYGRLLIADTSAPEETEAADWQNRVETLRDPSHVCDYSRQEWRTMVEAAGFTIEAMDETPGEISITLADWMLKAGCSPEQQAAVRHEFEQAPQSAVRAFRITRLADGDVGFAWPRLALKAGVLQ